MHSRKGRGSNPPTVPPIEGRPAQCGSVPAHRSVPPIGQFRPSGEIKSHRARARAATAACTTGSCLPPPPRSPLQAVGLTSLQDAAGSWVG